MSPDSPPPTLSRPSLLIFLSVALLAGAVLGFEVALTRVFAVLLRYQFAFLVISLALCGLGLGGLWAHKKRDLDLSNTAVFFGISASLSLLLILRGVFALRPDQFWLAALLVLVPFGAGGAFLAAVFARYSEWGGKLYAYDLAGAALAALFSVALMQWLSAIETCLLFAALGAAAGALAAQKRAFPLILSAILLLLVPYNARFGLWSVPNVPPMADQNGATLADRGVTQPLFTELGDPKAEARIIDTRWNAFARTDVVIDPSAPDSYLLYTNGNVPTNMMRWDGNGWTIAPIAAQFPLSDWVFKSANLKGADVLSIGPGGGLDALLALRHGARRFDGAEINPSIVGLMNEPRYKEFNGGIYARPEINVETAEGRAFVREAAQSGKRYRLIFSALTKTATAGSGTALLESFIYTSDALDDYLKALDDEGQVAIVGDAPLLLARLFATATAHFKAQGMTEREAGTHLAAVFYPPPGPYQWALIVKKTPFTPAQTAQMASDARAAQIAPLWLPFQPTSAQLPDLPIGSLGAGSLSLNGFIASGQKNGFNLAPAPDDRPFVLDLGRFQSRARARRPAFRSRSGPVAVQHLFFLAQSEHLAGPERGRDVRFRGIFAVWAHQFRCGRALDALFPGAGPGFYAGRNPAHPKTDSAARLPDAFTHGDFVFDSARRRRGRGLFAAIRGRNPARARPEMRARRGAGRGAIRPSFRLFERCDALDAARAALRGGGDCALPARLFAGHAVSVGSAPVFEPEFESRAADLGAERNGVGRRFDCGSHRRQDVRV